MFIYYNQNVESDLIELMEYLIKTFPDYMREPKRLWNILKLIRGDREGNITVVVEQDYVDKQYRDSYYNYFSQKYSNYERNSVRLAFFQGYIEHDKFYPKESIEKQLIGSIVLRPLNIGNIGHTLLNPHKLDIKGFCRTGDFKLLINGCKFSIQAFPFCSQDGESMTCAETVLFNLIQYYSNKYSEYRILMPSEILDFVEMNSYERVLPSEGLSEQRIAKVLAENHFYPKLYHYSPEFMDWLYSYVESGIPFVLGIPNHVVTCVGHGPTSEKLNTGEFFLLLEEKKLGGNASVWMLNTSRLVEQYIVMDDNAIPYYATSIDSLVKKYCEDRIAQRIEQLEMENQESSLSEKSVLMEVEKVVDTAKNEEVSMIVPLYRRIFIDVARASNVFKTLFLEDSLFLKNIISAYNDPDWGTKENPFVWRMYLAASRSYRDFKIQKSANKILKYCYMDYPFPRFIWILEIGTIQTYKKRKARVEVILDATSSPYNESTFGIISVGYKNHYIFIPEISMDEDDGTWYDNDKLSMPKSLDSEHYLGSLEQKNNERMLTKMFFLLYNSVCDFYEETYDIYQNNNLEEV